MVREFLIYKQIVDNYGGELERVKDVRFVKKDGKLILVQVVVGMRGLLRRLGIENAVSSFCKRFFDYDLRESYIAWDYIEPIGDQRRLRLEIPAQSHLARRQPSDGGDLIEDMNSERMAAVADPVSQEAIAGALDELDSEARGETTRGPEPGLPSDIVEQSPKAAARGFAGDPPEDAVDDILRAMDDEYQAKLKGVPEQEENEIEGLMTTRFVALAQANTVLDALAYAKQTANDMDVIDYIYVVDEESRLLGVVNFRELLSNEIFTPLERIMATGVITVHPAVRAAGLVDVFIKHGFKAIPVVDEANRIKGVIRFKAILDILASNSRNC